MIVKSYLHLADLAGSERIKKSRAIGKKNDILQVLNTHYII